MNTLFDLPESKSPRLLWMERHQVTIRKSGSQEVEVCPEGGGDIFPFEIYSGPIFGADEQPLYGPCGCGMTEDEAFADLAKQLKVKLWNEE